MIEKHDCYTSLIKIVYFKTNCVMEPAKEGIMEIIFNEKLLGIIQEIIQLKILKYQLDLYYNEVSHK